MQGVVRAGGQLAVHRDELLHLAHLAGDDDAVAAETERLGPCAALARADSTSAARVTSAALRGASEAAFSFIMRVARLWSRLPQFNPDPHRPAVLHGRLDHGREALVALLPEPDVAGVDPILGEGPGALGKAGEEAVAVVVEVADERNAAPRPVEGPPDLGSRGGRVRIVDGDADELRARASERPHLGDGGRDVGRVRVRHRLDHDRGAGPDHDAAHAHSHRASPRLALVLHPAPSHRAHSVRAKPPASHRRALPATGTAPILSPPSRLVETQHGRAGTGRRRDGARGPGRARSGVRPGAAHRWIRR